LSPQCFCHNLQSSVSPPQHLSLSSPPVCVRTSSVRTRDTLVDSDRSRWETMTGRVIIVTGASSGLGYETARYLCEGGNFVILGCRDEEKATRAIEKIMQQNPNALATYMHLDLSSLESVRKFVDEFHATGKKLHVIVNNAELAMNFKDVKRQYTADGFELTIGTNHLGHFLLTNLLLDDLRKAAENGDARVVVVTSALHDTCCKRTRSKRRLRCCSSTRNCFSTSGNLVYTAASNPRTAWIAILWLKNSEFLFYHLWHLFLSVLVIWFVC